MVEISKSSTEIKQKNGEHECVLFNLTFRFNEMSVLADPAAVIPISEYRSNPPIIDRREVYDKLNRRGELEIDGIICGSSSTIMLELPDASYAILTYRDAKAPRYPNALDGLGGMINTLDFAESATRETFEEVILVNDASALIPQYPPETPLSLYNNEISEYMLSLSRRFGIEDAHSICGRMTSLEEPMYMNDRRDMPVGFVLNDWGFGDGPLIAADILIPPLIIKLDSLNLLQPRETLEIETNGRAPERDVVLVQTTANPKQPGVVVFRRGEEIARYPTFERSPFVQYAGSERKVCHTIAATFRHIGLSEHLIGKQYAGVMLSGLLRSDQEPISSAGQNLISID